MVAAAVVVVVVRECFAPYGRLMDDEGSVRSGFDPKWTRMLF
jgi:hypothetical protein